MHDLLRAALGDEAANLWHQYTAVLPANMSLEELRDFMWADTDEQQEEIYVEYLQG